MKRKVPMQMYVVFNLGSRQAGDCGANSGLGYVEVLRP